jgi:prolyl oligopeptidase
MRKRVAVTAAAFVLCAATAALAALPPAPVAKKVPVTDTYFGQTVVDPYRWMETPGNPDLLAYLKAQNDRTRAILDSMPGRATLVARLKQLADTNVASSSVVVHRGTYFYEKTPPGANSVKLYVRVGMNGAERVLVDPDAMPGPRVAISAFLPSNDGRRVAVVLAPGGSENGVLHVMDVASGTMLPDASDRADFGPVGWSDDNGTVYYLRRQVLNPGDPPMMKYLNVRTYAHVVGQPSSSDVAVFGAGVNPSVTIPTTVFAIYGTSPETPYVSGVVVAGVDRFATVYVAPKSAAGNPATIPWRRVISRDDMVTTAAVHGDTIYALTAKNAPRFRLVTFKIGQTFADAVDLIPAGSRVLDNVASASDGVYLLSREDGLGRITRIGYDGTRTEIPLPYNGTIAGLATEYDRPGFLLQLEGWTESPRWYAYDPAAHALVDTRLDAPSPVDYSGIAADEVRVPARDGTMIPLSIIHRRDMKLDGSNPTMLYAYGSYGISSDPSFSAARLAWLERGGILAIAHVRGGGEYGEEWHLAGKDANKINTVYDFIDCAKWMIAQRYTSPGKLGARGGSAGGITMGGAITRDPADFAAVLDEIPVSDQLRIETSPNGPPNVPEFGSVKTEQGFKNLYATSAVQHVVPGTHYPAVMLTTGINDPRVDPWQAAKMAATLQDANAGPRPILLRVDYNGGHGLIGGTRSQGVDLTADEDAFLLWQFGDPLFQPRGM